MTDQDPRLRFETRAIHAGQDPDGPYGCGERSHLPDVDVRQDAVGEPKVWDYARGGNPTREAFERRSPRSRAARTGSRSRSGLGAETTAADRRCCPGEHVVVGDDVYGGTYRLSTGARPVGVEHASVDLTDLDAVRAALTAGHEAGVARDADEPAAEDRRHRGACATRRPRARRAASSSTTRSPRRTCSAARARRRHRRALGDQVPRRPQRRRRRPSSPSDDELAERLASCRTRPARCPARSTATSCCAA